MRLPGHIGDSAHVAACVVQRSMADAKDAGLCRGSLQWLPSLDPVVAQWLGTLQSAVKHVLFTGHAGRVLGLLLLLTRVALGRHLFAIALKRSTHRGVHAELCHPAQHDPRIRRLHHQHRRMQRPRQQRHARLLKMQQHISIQKDALPKLHVLFMAYGIMAATTRAQQLYSVHLSLT